MPTDTLESLTADLYALDAELAELHGRDAAVRTETRELAATVTEREAALHAARADGRPESVLTDLRRALTEARERLAETEGASRVLEGRRKALRQRRGPLAARAAEHQAFQSLAALLTAVDRIAPELRRLHDAATADVVEARRAVGATGDTAHAGELRNELALYQGLLDAVAPIAMFSEPSRATADRPIVGGIGDGRSRPILHGDG